MHWHPPPTAVRIRTEVSGRNGGTSGMRERVAPSVHLLTHWCDAIGAAALDRATSSLFGSYPTVTKRHHAMDFLVDGLKQLVDGCSAEELNMLFDAELETHHAQDAQPIGLIRTAGDALPGLGIVAAVLGIVI